MNTHPQQYLEERITREAFHRKEPQAGKIAIVTNTDIAPSGVYEVYRVRQHVERRSRSVSQALTGGVNLYTDP